MRKNDLLASQLKSWGFAKANRYTESIYAAHDPGDHPISRAREFAPMTRERAAKALAGRGTDRRRLMAAYSSDGKFQLRILPEWAVDPIVCTESRIDGPIPMSPSRIRAVAAVDWAVPEELRWIDRAVAQLSRVSLICALCLETEFCETGTQVRKAEVVESRYGGKMSVWQYRRELARGLDWLRMNRVA